MFVFKTRKIQVNWYRCTVFSLPTYVYTSSLKYCADMLQITRILIQVSFSLVVLFLVADVCLYFKT